MRAAAARLVAGRPARGPGRPHRRSRPARRRCRDRRPCERVNRSSSSATTSAGPASAARRGTPEVARPVKRRTAGPGRRDGRAPSRRPPRSRASPRSGTGTASAERAAGRRAGPSRSSISAMVVKLPSDLDILSLPAITQPWCTQWRANGRPSATAWARSFSWWGKIEVDRRRRGGRSPRPAGRATSPRTRCASRAGPRRRARPRSARPAWPPSTARSRAGSASPRRPRPGRPACSDVERLVGEQPVALDPAHLEVHARSRCW